MNKEMSAYRQMMIDLNEYGYYDTPVDFTFAKKRYRAPLNFAYLNGRLDEILNKYKIKHDKSWMVTKHLSSKNYKQMMNMFVNKLFEQRINKLVADDIMLEIINLISDIINLLDSGAKVSLDMSLTSLVYDSMEDERIRHILYDDHITDDMIPDEIVEKKEKITKDLMSYNFTGIKHLLRSGAGVKADQLFNCFVGLWLRTRIQNMDEIAPVVVHERWIDGLRTRKTLFIETNNNRKAAINNKQHIKDSGTESKHSSILAQDTYISTDDCGSVHGLKIFVTDEMTLKTLVHKYQMMPNGTLREITLNDKHLIGTHVIIRSILKCASPEGICKKCYGAHADWSEHTALYRRDLGSECAKSIGGPIWQDVLSLKHNVTPDNVPVKFYITNLKTGELSDDHTGLFERKFNKIILKKGVSAYLNSNDVSNPGMAKGSKNTIFEEGSIKYIDTEYDEYDIIRTPIIYMVKNKTEYKIEVEATVTKTHLVARFIDFKIKGFERFIKQKNTIIDITDKELMYVIANRSKNDKVEKLKELYGAKTYTGSGSNKNGVLYIQTLEEFMEKIKECLPDIHVSGAEILFRNKIKSKSNNRFRPDWTKPDAENDYVILSSSEAINKLRSVSIKLGLGWFNMRITNPFYYNRNNIVSSKYDILFDTDDEINNKEVYRYADEDIDDNVEEDTYE